MVGEARRRRERVTWPDCEELDEVPCDYEVVGEHVHDAMRLLVLGSDRRFYALSLVDGHVEPTDLTDQWILDAADLTDKLRHLCPDAA